MRGGASDNVKLSTITSNEEILKALNWLKDRSESAAVLVKTYKNGETFYRKYSDGFIIQGGYFANRDTLGEGAQHTVTLPTSFSNAKYKVLRSARDAVVGGDCMYYTSPKSQTSSSFVAWNDSSRYYAGTYWLAFGY